MRIEDDLRKQRAPLTLDWVELAAAGLTLILFVTFLAEESDDLALTLSIALTILFSAICLVRGIRGNVGGLSRGGYLTLAWPSLVFLSAGISPALASSMLFALPLISIFFIVVNFKPLILSKYPGDWIVFFLNTIWITAICAAVFIYNP